MPLPPCTGCHCVPSKARGSGTCLVPCWGPSTLHGVSGAHGSLLGRGHNDVVPLPCGDATARPQGNILLLLYKSHLCIPPHWQGPSSGEEVQQLLKRQQHRMGTARGWRCPLLRGGTMGCPLPLLAPALPSPNAEAATCQNAVATGASPGWSWAPSPHQPQCHAWDQHWQDLLSPPQEREPGPSPPHSLSPGQGARGQQGWQVHGPLLSPPPCSPVPCHQSRAQFTEEAGAGHRNAFHLWPADPWRFPAATPVLG